MRRLPLACLNTVEVELENVMREKERAVAQVHEVEARARRLMATLQEPQCHLPGCACNGTEPRPAVTR